MLLNTFFPTQSLLLVVIHVDPAKFRVGPIKLGVKLI